MVCQCTMCTLYSFFSSRPSEVRLILKSPKCCTIQHKFVPARSVERNIEKIRFPWASNSKFVIFSQIFPRSNYKICPIIPRLFPVSNGDSPVSTTFPRSNYRGFLTTGESYCPMYTLCTGVGERLSWADLLSALLFCFVDSIQTEGIVFVTEEVPSHIFSSKWRKLSKQVRRSIFWCMIVALWCRLWYI